MIEQRKIVGIVTQIRHRGSLLAATLKPLAVSSADLTRWDLDLTLGRKPTTEFPNAGKLSWLSPDGVEEGSVWQFTVKEQPSYHDAPNDPIRDQYMVEPASARPCFPVLDLAFFGDEQVGRQILTHLGIKLSSDEPREYYIRTEGNLWTSNETELVAEDAERPNSHLMPINNDGMTRWVEWTPDVEPFELACDPRCVHTSFRWLLLAPGTSPTGPTRLRDWSSDATVLQHLLRALRKCDSDFAKKMHLTNASIAQIARVLSNGTEAISNPGLEKARLHRVEEYIKSLKTGEEVARAAMSVIEHSPIADVIEQRKMEILDEERQAAKKRSEKELESEKAELERIRNLKQVEQEKLDQLECQCEAARAKREEQVQNLEEHLAERLAHVLENAEEIVASSAMIRAITGRVPQRTSTLRRQPAQAVVDTNELHDQTVALNQIRNALSKRDVPHQVAGPLFAGFLSGLVPILSGSRAFSALSAFADCATGGRIEWIPVSPGWLDPSDFVGKPPGADLNHPCGLLELLIDARDSDHLYLVVLDGINVAPSDTVLQPLLACHSDAVAGFHTARSLPIVDARDASASRVQWPSNVLLAATTNPAGHFPFHEAVWDTAIYLCCDAVTNAALIGANDKHPDQRPATAADLVSAIRVATWREWRKQGQDRPLKECASLLIQTDGLAKLSRPARDSVVRFFTASCGTQDSASALLDTAAFTLLPHVIGDEPGAFLSGKTPTYYDNQIAVSEFLKLNQIL